MSDAWTSTLRSLRSLPRNQYMGLFKFQLHELAAVRANDTCHDLSAADIDTLFASPGKALFDAALYDVPAIPREIARDCLVVLYEETGDRSPGQVFLKCCERLRHARRESTRKAAPVPWS